MRINLEELQKLSKKDLFKLEEKYQIIISEARYNLDICYLAKRRLEEKKENE